VEIGCDTNFLFKDAKEALLWNTSAGLTRKNVMYFTCFFNLLIMSWSIDLYQENSKRLVRLQ